MLILGGIILLFFTEYAMGSSYVPSVQRGKIADYDIYYNTYQYVLGPFIKTALLSLIQQFIVCLPRRGCNQTLNWAGEPMSIWKTYLWWAEHHLESLFFIVVWNEVYARKYIGLGIRKFKVKVNDLDIYLLMTPWTSSMFWQLQTFFQETYRI